MQFRLQISFLSLLQSTQIYWHYCKLVPTAKSVLFLLALLWAVKKNITINIYTTYVIAKRKLLKTETIRLSRKFHLSKGKQIRLRIDLFSLQGHKLSIIITRFCFAEFILSSLCKEPYFRILRYEVIRFIIWLKMSKTLHIIIILNVLS